ncbi:PREDICTED: isoamylase 2, chloroplastic [Ipomoea nil]|uniref:isoamylase 2, chloroplastic n=1 Tax=Ipomoea nil TaxID=35883 RepID=UPI000900B16E|nr:PREDICTED: isoamylase 2, chloroplastic [Ipomoea nil]
MAMLPLSSVLQSCYLGRGTAGSSKSVACARGCHSERVVCGLRNVDAVQKPFYWNGGNFTQKISSTPYGLMVVAATAADTSVIQTAGQVSKYLFRTETTGLVKVSVDKRNSKYGVQIQVLPSELDGRLGELVMIWGLFRSDSQSLMSLDSQGVGTSNKQSTVETVFQSKSSGKLVELDFELSLAPFYLSFFLKSELASEVNNSEIKSHRKTNFVVPIGFSSGHPAPLGLSFLSDGSVNFAVLSRSSESVVLCLYDDMRKEKPVIELDLDPYVNRSGDIWHASIDGSLPFVGYGYRCKGATAEKTEHVLLDPYAKIIVDYNPPGEGFNLVPRCLGQLCKKPAFDWSNDIRPNIPMETLVVYHLNVCNFTKDKSSKLPAQVAGTFSGITEKLQHFKDIGVNAILLEPIFPFDEQKGPYFPMHFFSPGHLCGPPGDPSSVINSMKQMVKEVHANGIEVFLQVVFTHTAEGASLLHIDKSSYYYLEGDMGMKSGNSLNCNYPPVQQMILDSLRHWVVEYHIDGFCFVNASFLTRGFHGEFLTHPPLIEAIAFDPLLSKVKLIADFWDPVEKTSKEIIFPHWKRWAEINSKFCDDVRNFLRGNGSLSKLATRLCGSGDVFSGGRGPAFSLNYIARNFGLPLVDLVSFSSREVASELSWNCGEEGPTNKNAVLERRLKQIRNFLFILFISLGVPVLNMGDECGRSSGGSPAYCDRKPFDWNALRTGFGVQTTQFISFLSKLRTRRSDLLQKVDFLDEENIEWHGSDQSPPRWVDPSNKFLAMTLKADTGEIESSTASDLPGHLFAAFNSADHSESVVLPPLPAGMAWYRLVDTALPFPGFFSEKGTPIEDGSATYEMKSHSCMLLEAKRTNG